MTVGQVLSRDVFCITCHPCIPLESFLSVCLFCKLEVEMAPCTQLTFETRLLNEMGGIAGTVLKSDVGIHSLANPPHLFDSPRISDRLTCVWRARVF